jgi:hypothetical protein
MLVPQAAVKSGPALHVVSLIRNLKVNERADSASTMRQRLSCTHSIANPFSQLKPGPSPRRKRALPKPTSMRALIVVCTGLLVTALTAAVETSDLVGASMATGAGVVVWTVTAGVDFFATLLDAVDFVAGVGEFDDLDVLFLDALIRCDRSVFNPLISQRASKSEANAPAAFPRFRKTQLAPREMQVAEGIAHIFDVNNRSDARRRVPKERVEAWSQ